MHDSVDYNLFAEPFFFPLFCFVLFISSQLMSVQIVCLHLFILFSMDEMTFSLFIYIYFCVLIICALCVVRKCGCLIIVLFKKHSFVHFAVFVFFRFSFSTSLSHHFASLDFPSYSYFFLLRFTFISHFFIFIFVQCHFEVLFALLGNRRLMSCSLNISFLFSACSLSIIFIREVAEYINLY